MYFLVIFFNIFIHFFLSLIFLYCIGTYSFFFFSQITFITLFTTLIPFCIPFCLIFSFLVKNPINTLLLILASFIGCSFLLFQISAEMLTYMFLIVYIGALMMLFLFVIMLFNLQHLKNPYNKKNLYLYIIISFIFLNLLSNFFDMNFYSLVLKNKIFFDSNTWFSIIFFFSNITSNGGKCLEILYTSESILFLFLTFLLLFTMLGAISLAMSTKRTFNLS